MQVPLLLPLIQSERTHRATLPAVPFEGSCLHLPHEASAASSSTLAGASGGSWAPPQEGCPSPHSNRAQLRPPRCGIWRHVPTRHGDRHQRGRRLQMKRSRASLPRARRLRVRPTRSQRRGHQFPSVRSEAKSLRCARLPHGDQLAPSDSYQTLRHSG